MTDLNEIINNWSFALFDLAKSSNKLIEITNESADIIKVLKQNKEYLKMLNSFDLSEESKFKMIDEAFNSYHPYILNMIKLATKKHVVKYIDIIFHRFIELSNDKLNIRYGHVYSVNPLTKTEISKLEKKLSKDLNSKVTLINEIDKNLIGGIKIKVDEYLIDNSVLGKLNKIKSLV
ncbi:F0F1 ATP synthase subunit delta [Mycoplasmopsis arginini]|uniref:F0F1 ATP synthase subunit delta n=1 Tax=Mycoplasmopsis arginini TaxID=2094 RepID=UPI000D608A53|nr:F0F1 ATP synthase subunit delta [Mycoplasmopsis arginini]MDI3348363.1 F0F1 ATP synthase subunit delta [Mycoplasmopsis arginini]MDP4042988.1 F0F1 ATP synthase subunit delta [Mycoplasmopsis arginini]PWC08723.1 ATP synthase F1 subunit delta [Mycoplasmopsis arginini]